MQQINIKENKQICHSQLLNKTKYYNNKTENSLYSEDYRSQSIVLEHILNKKKSKIPVTLVIQISKHVKKLRGNTTISDQTENFRKEWQNWQCVDEPSFTNLLI